MQSSLGADQLAWLINDLARVNRAVTPWVTVSWHQPPVSSSLMPSLAAVLSWCDKVSALHQRLLVSGCCEVSSGSCAVGSLYNALVMCFLSCFDALRLAVVVKILCSLQYNSYTTHYKESECLRQMVEPFLYNFGVDVVFHGGALSIVSHTGCSALHRTGVSH